MAKKTKRDEKFNYNASVSALRAEGPAGLYLIWGPEDYLADRFFEEIKKLCITSEADDFSYRRLDERDFSALSLREAVDSVPFLSERSLVEVRGVDINKLKDADPKAAERIHPNNVKKVIRALEGAINGSSIVDFKNCHEKCKDYDTILIGLTRNRPELYDRINRRVDIMVEQGIFNEVEQLLEMGLDEDDISMKGIGYKEIIGFFDGLYSQEEAIDLIKKNSRHLAKRQLTWFRRYEDMKWFNLSEYTNDEDAVGEIIKWLQTQGI